MKRIVTIFFISFFTFSASAKVQLIKYKKYYIPVLSVDKCEKPKVIVSTDIRPLKAYSPPRTAEDDDVQAMVHYLVSSYRFDTRGLISSPGGGTGTKNTINWVLDNYAKDRNSLIGNTGRAYPPISELESVVVQGNKDTSGILPTYDSTNIHHQGAKLIRSEVDKIINGGECGPIYFLAWGGLSDLAIALKGNDATEPISNQQVAENVRVFSIGASNTYTASEDPIQGIYWDYIRNNYLAYDSLWLIHSDETFRGVYKGHETALGELKLGLKNFGCLGKVLGQTDTDSSDIKMGDSSSVLYLMNGDPDSPTSNSWGGRFRLVQNKTQYWTDINGTNSARWATISPVGNVVNKVATPVDSIYGAWYEDMRRASGSGCVPHPN